jgi:hypothetical protein
VVGYAPSGELVSRRSNPQPAAACGARCGTRTWLDRELSPAVVSGVLAASMHAHGPPSLPQPQHVEFLPLALPAFDRLLDAPRRGCSSTVKVGVVLDQPRQATKGSTGSWLESLCQTRIKAIHRHPCHALDEALANPRNHASNVSARENLNVRSVVLLCQRDERLSVDESRMTCRRDCQRVRIRWMFVLERDRGVEAARYCGHFEGQLCIVTVGSARPKSPTPGHALRDGIGIHQQVPDS